jgi:hypothetical protein
LAFTVLALYALPLPLNLAVGPLSVGMAGLKKAFESSIGVSLIPRRAAPWHTPASKVAHAVSSSTPIFLSIKVQCRGDENMGWVHMSEDRVKSS